MSGERRNKTMDWMKKVKERGRVSPLGEFSNWKLIEKLIMFGCTMYFGMWLNRFGFYRPVWW